MAVRIEKTFEVSDPIDKVWVLLSDPRKVVSCVPGAKILEAVDEHTFKGAISVKVGPSLTEYKGEVKIVRVDEQAHVLEMEGRGQDVRGKGGASMKMTGTLQAIEAGGTRVTAVSEVNVVGILAQFGGRMLTDVSDIIFKQFTERFQQKLKNPEAEPQGAAEPVKAVRLVGSALSHSIRRALGGPDES
ncbi:MAG TPA: SRPBCC family protein [Candidatus Acidoferrales bacterium]|jgi:carbon monoxide dehydrogenase subunit G|nr:SRPBCC family protein [Candidatus Acidoferrales bacterium]